MRKLMLSTLLGLGALGFTAASPTEAKASWLSEAFEHSRIEVNVGPQYPAYSAPVYAPAPVYPVYRPVPTYTPAYYPVPTYVTPTYTPAPVYAPAPVIPVQAYRPAYVPYVPQHSYYGPNRWEQERHEGRDHRNEHDWRR